MRRDRNRAVKHAEWYAERSVAGLVAGLVAGSVRHSTDSLRWTREPCEPHDSGAISLDDKWTRAVWVAAWLLGCLAPNLSEGTLHLVKIRELVSGYNQLGNQRTMSIVQ